MSTQRLSAQIDILNAMLQRRRDSLCSKADFADLIADLEKRFQSGALVALRLVLREVDGKAVPDHCLEQVRALPATVRRMASNARRELRQCPATWTLSAEQSDEQQRNDGRNER